MPEFQGEGVAGFRRYIQQQVAYPEEAAEKDLEGTSFIKFIVNKKGAVEDIEVARSSHEVLDQAAMDAIEGAPKWRPGKQRGNKVKVQFTMPVAFRLSEKQK
jgi:protein TonB